MVYSATDLFTLGPVRPTVLDAVISHVIRGIYGTVRNTVNMLMVPATGVGALADTIRWFLNNKARCTELGPNAPRIKLEECSLEPPARRYAELYASVV